MPQNVIIVGGGASGLLTSILIKEARPDVDVIVLERLERVGKKLLATGGGKGNLTNRLISYKNLDGYNDNEFVAGYLKRYPVPHMLNKFMQLGLVTTELKDGRIYPKAESANAILDVLRLRMRSLNIKEECNFEVRKITELEDCRYQLESTRNKQIVADRVVLSTGGKSSPMLGSNGTGYELLRKLKVDITPLYPGLVGIKTEDNAVKGLDGIRLKASVKLFIKKDKNPVYEESGEIQFKNNALSGIVIMNIESVLARLLIKRAGQPSHLSLNLLSEYQVEDLIAMFKERKEALINYANTDFLVGLFPKMVAQNILKRARIALDGNVLDLTDKELVRIVECIVNWEIPIKDLEGYEYSQVTVGGVALNEVDRNLSLEKYTNIYIAGELLNIDGLCGGYNLTWAWLSAFVISNAIIKRLV